jgi:hypothetical protein
LVLARTLTSNPLIAIDPKEIGCLRWYARNARDVFNCINGKLLVVFQDV